MSTSTAVTATAGGVVIATAYTTYISSFGTLATSGTHTIAMEDFSKSVLYVANQVSNASTIITIGAGGDFNSIGIGSKSYTIASANIQVIAGLESSRFKDGASGNTAGTAGNITITNTSGAACTIGLIKIPW